MYRPDSLTRSASPSRPATPARAARGRRLSAAASSVVEPLEGRSMFSVTPDPGASFTTAFNVGSLNGATTFDDAVGPADTTDIYRFEMPRAGQFFGRIRAFSAKAEVALVQEQIDPDGTVHDVFVDAVTATQDGPDAGFDSGDLPGRILQAGNYFLVVTALGGSTPYLIRMTADYAGTTMSAARDVGSATDATFRDFVGQFPSPSLNDPFDFYKVKLDAAGRFSANLALDSTQADTFAAHLQLIRDANGNGAIDAGDSLATTTSGTTATINADLAAGTYFVRVVSDLNFSNYSLHVNADYAGATPATTRATGVLDVGKGFNDYLDAATDPVDQYRFSVNATRPLRLAVAESNGGTSTIALYRDANGNGIADPGELRISTSAASFNNLLTTVQAGNYLVRVTAAAGRGTYQMFAEAKPDLAGNTLATAPDLKAVNGRTDQADYVSSVDPVDFYKFTASAAGTISARVVPELNGDVDLALIRDANNNGKVDANEVLAASTLNGSQFDQVRKSVAAGTYFVRVTFKPAAEISQYSLTIATDYAGETTATARNVGALAGTKTFDDWASGPFGGVISDTSDLYKFTLASAKTLTAKTTGTLSGEDLDLELYSDKNHDGVLTANERVAVSKHADSPSEQIVKALSAGTYFARVVGVNGETNYHLSLKA